MYNDPDRSAISAPWTYQTFVKLNSSADLSVIHECITLDDRPKLKYDGSSFNFNTVSGTTAPSVDTWYGISGVTDASGNGAVFVNGQQQNSASGLLTSYNESPYDTGIYLGSDNNLKRWLYGSLDEVRLSNVARSDAWLKLDYHAQTDNLLTFSATDEFAVETNSPTNITSNSAQLNGTLNSLQGNSSLDVYFEYGTSTSYGSTTSAQTISSVPTSFSDTIFGLTTFVEYHYRSVATDGSNYWYGADVSFFTHDLKDVDETQSDWQEGTLTDVVGTINDTLGLANDYALSFDGSDDYVDLPDGFNIFDGSQSFSIELGYEQHSGGRQLLIGPNAEKELKIQTGEHQADNVVHVRLNLNGTWQDIVLASGHNYNQRYHLAITYDPTDGFKLYKDGSLEDSNSATGTIASDTDHNQIGGSISKNDYYWNGKIDEVRIWNITRTQTEIQNNKDSKLTGNETGLIAYYPIDEGSGSTLYDDAGSNNGTINGATWKTLDYLSSGNRLSPQLDLSTLGTYDDSLIEWTATTPTDTSITIETRYSLDGGSSWSSWQTCTNGSEIPGFSSGDDLSNGLFECKQTLSTSDTSTTPELHSLEIYFVESTGTKTIYVPLSKVSFTDKNVIGEASKHVETSKVYTQSLDSNIAAASEIPKAEISFLRKEQLYTPFFIYVPKSQVSFDFLESSPEVSVSIEDYAYSDDVFTTVHGVFESVTTTESLSVDISPFSVTETAVGTEALSIDVSLGISDVSTSEDKQLFKKRVRDWVRKATERIRTSRPNILITDTLSGEDFVSIRRLISISDSCSGEEIYPSGEISGEVSGENYIPVSVNASISDTSHGIDNFDLIINVVAQDVGVGSETAGGIFSAKVRDYPLVKEVFTVTNLVDTIYDLSSGLDLVRMQQSITISDSGTGDDHDPRGCGTVLEYGLGSDEISISGELKIDDSASGSEDVTLHKLITVTDSASGDDSVDSRFVITDDCTGDDVSDTEQAAILIQDIINTTDDAKQVYSGEEGDIMIKITNSVGSLRIAYIVDFTRPEQYTHKIKESCLGTDKVEIV